MSNTFHVSEIFIMEGDAFVGNPEPPVHAVGRRERAGGIRAGSPSDGKKRFLVVGGLDGIFNILARASARVNPSAITKPTPGIKVEMSARALKNWLTIPGDAEPAQILDCGLDKFRPAATGIEVFNHEGDCPSGSALEGRPKWGGVADVQKSGWRRSEASAVDGRDGIDNSRLR